MSKDCWGQNYGNYKKFENAEKAIDEDENDVVSCLLVAENKKECKKESLVCGRCETALRGWYNVHH